MPIATPFERRLNIRMLQDDGTSVAFPNSEYPIIINAFTYDEKVMGNAPTISCTINYIDCLDDIWDLSKTFILFGGEQYFLKDIPTSSYSNDSVQYVHEAVFIAERVKLETVLFFDVVDTSVQIPEKPFSNSAEFSFYGGLRELAGRINSSLAYSGLPYTVVIDDNVKHEEKQFNVSNAYIYDVLTQAYEAYNTPFYFVGYEIHFGNYQTQFNFRNNPIEYGIANELLSIRKETIAETICTRMTGVGNDRNLPYYYPNKSPQGTLAPYIAAADGTPDISFNVGVSNDSLFHKKNKLTTEYVYKSEGLVLGIPSYNTYAQFEQSIVPEYLLDIYTNPTYGKTVSVTLAFTPQNIPYPYVKIGDITFDLDKYRRIYYDAGLSPFQLTDDIEMRLYYRPWNGNYEEISKNSLLKVPYMSGGYVTVEYKFYGIARVYQAGQEAQSALDAFRAAMDDCVNLEIVPFIPNWVQTFEGEEELDIRNKANINLEEVGIAQPTLADGTLWHPIDGSKIKIQQVQYLMPSDRLMPSIYRDSAAQQRFYNAINYPYTHTAGTEVNAAMGEIVDGSQVKNPKYLKTEQGITSYYNFLNEYDPAHPYERIEEFDVQPTIKNVKNASNEYIQYFSEFAYDLNDNDEFDEAGNYIHPYFFAKLRKTDGDMGFNLFDQAIESGEMTISMTSGKCGSCNFIIGVSEDNKNLVQIDINGNLLRNDNGDVICGREGQPKQTPQDAQNDTLNNEVWIALKKDIDTFGVVMPNVTNDYKPTAGTDSFVIINIDLPIPYVLAAENELTRQIIERMFELNSQQFAMTINFSSIFFEENPSTVEQLRGLSKLYVRYNSKVYETYTDALQYVMTEDKYSPSITITLRERIKLVKSFRNTLLSDITQLDSALRNTFDRGGFQEFNPNTTANPLNPSTTIINNNITTPTIDCDRLIVGGVNIAEQLTSLKGAGLDNKRKIDVNQFVGETNRKDIKFLQAKDEEFTKDIEEIRKLIESGETEEKQLVIPFDEKTNSIRINHSFAKVPTVKIVLDDGTKVEAIINYIDATSIVVSWNESIKGNIYIN